ncbi:MAG: hypothetical protein O2871_01605 [bacterium]|nr:hypothetical protein [bacterium]
MKKIVIVGSAKLKSKIKFWKKYWEKEGFDVIDYPKWVEMSNFLNEYPTVYKTFFLNIYKADVLFIMNETKNNIEGYIGAESFAEICFTVVQNLINNTNIEILLLQVPDRKVQSYQEVDLWLKLGWLKLYKK